MPRVLGDLAGERALHQLQQGRLGIDELRVHARIARAAQEIAQQPGAGHVDMRGRGADVQPLHAHQIERGELRLDLGEPAGTPIAAQLDSQPVRVAAGDQIGRTREGWRVVGRGRHLAALLPVPAARC